MIVISSPLRPWGSSGSFLCWLSWWMRWCRGGPTRTCLAWCYRVVAVKASAAILILPLGLAGPFNQSPVDRQHPLPPLKFRLKPNSATWVAMTMRRCTLGTTFSAYFDSKLPQLRLPDLIIKFQEGQLTYIDHSTSAVTVRLLAFNFNCRT